MPKLTRKNLARGKTAKPLFIGVSGLFLRLKVFSMIISMGIKVALRGLTIQNLAIFRIDLKGKLQGKIDKKIDLDHSIFMPKFYAVEAIDKTIFLTSCIDLEYNFILTLTLIFYLLTSNNFLSRFFDLICYRDFSIFPVIFSQDIFSRYFQFSDSLFFNSRLLS